jgi:hypothetical protein
LETYGDGFFTDEDLRTYFKMSRARFEAFVSHLVDIKVLRRKEGNTGNLCRAGDYNPATVEKRVLRAGETGHDNSPLLDLAAQVNALGRKLTDFMRTGSTGFARTNPGQDADSELQTSHQTEPEAPIDNRQFTDKEQSEAASLDSSRLASPSLHEDSRLASLVPESPTLMISNQPQEFDLRMSLRSHGLDENQIDRCIKAHETEFIVDGIRYLEEGKWRKNSNDATTLLSYFNGTLHISKHWLENRRAEEAGQVAAVMSVNGDKTAPSTRSTASTKSTEALSRPDFTEIRRAAGLGGPP